MDWPIIYLMIMIAFAIAVTLIVFWLRQPWRPPAPEHEEKRHDGASS